jgi:hypothetical protein
VKNASKSERKMAWKGSTARVYEYMIENILKRLKIV